ncbi:MAG: 4-(cytidine 5'-diphospho)-2-C-methyl-D-erythritol kinase [SAR324 cluster bacterium]|nr:4-(cytidine 5'-diphospho)-2-C-methyl-D-erythritol kinase [SAR324 cluster bacterium]
MIRIKTPAKINTILQILYKRPDGYHDLFMHMVPISLFDTLEFFPETTGPIQLEETGIRAGVDPEKNLVIKAVRLFEKQTRIKVSGTIKLHKTVPTGAGLGGGSANAAGVLVLLNQYYDQPLNHTDLHQLAQPLGSDVPFFLKPTPAEVHGKGEVLKPLAGYPELPLLVIKPPFSIPTVEAYRQCTPKPLQTIPQIHTLAELLGNLHNQFESTLFPAYPDLAQIKQLLLEHGALGALVSGSGSAVFGIFENELSRNQSIEYLRPQISGEIFSCKILENYSYF